MTLTYVDANGNSASVESNLSIQNMLTLRHTEKMSWYNNDKPETTVAGKSGLSYVQMESLRRSLTWREEATAFIDATEGLDYSEENLKKLGCMSAERKSQPQKGNRNGGKKNGGMSKSSYTEFGELVVTELVQTNYLKVPEDKMVTLDWAKTNWGIVKGAFNVSDAELLDLPDKPKSHTMSEKNAALEAQVAELSAQIAELMKAQGNNSDAE